jgi:hypothetical protein
MTEGEPASETLYVISIPNAVERVQRNFIVMTQPFLEAFTKDSIFKYSFF